MECSWPCFMDTLQTTCPAKTVKLKTADGGDAGEFRSTWARALFGGFTLTQKNRINGSVKNPAIEIEVGSINWPECCKTPVFTEQDLQSNNYRDSVTESSNTENPITESVDTERRATELWMLLSVSFCVVCVVCLVPPGRDRSKILRMFSDSPCRQKFTKTTSCFLILRGEFLPAIGDSGSQPSRQYRPAIRKGAGG